MPVFRFSLVSGFLINFEGSKWFRIGARRSNRRDTCFHQARKGQPRRCQYINIPSKSPTPASKRAKHHGQYGASRSPRCNAQGSQSFGSVWRFWVTGAVGIADDLQKATIGARLFFGGASTESVVFLLAFPFLVNPPKKE